MRLDQINRYRENRRIEAKLAAGGLPRSLWSTYSGFANGAGGIILLGVEELKNGELRVVGVPNPEEQVREFWEIIEDRAQVNLNILRERDVSIEKVEGKRIIVIEVPRAKRKERPVFLGTNPFEGSYRRRGSGDYHCSEDEVRKMLSDRGIKGEWRGRV